MTPLEQLAQALAVAAPPNRGSGTSHTPIPWRLIEAVRRQLDNESIEWRQAAKDYEAEQVRRRIQAAQDRATMEARWPASARPVMGSHGLRRSF